jgi:plasmid maintenance system antidote protein VapI
MAERGKAVQHLAEIIEEEMRERGWTITDLVMNMGPFADEREWGICQLSWEMFLEVREPCVVLGDVMAQQLADAFDVDPQFFTNLHEVWRKSAS